MRHRDRAEYAAVMRLVGQGLPDREVGLRTGVPRATVGRWRRDETRFHRRLYALREAWRPPAPREYCYLLGLYLGDGHVVRTSPHAAALVLSLDRRYPAIAQAALDALVRAFPDAAPTRSGRRSMAVELVRVSHPAVAHALPQHGPGKKHSRTIELRPWQKALTRRHPAWLLRGLIHSDGCRTVNRFYVRLPGGRRREYAYPRYFFTNLSGDVREIFTDHCDLLGIRWTQPTSRNISIAERESVARLDAFIGPKA